MTVVDDALAKLTPGLDFTTPAGRMQGAFAVRRASRLFALNGGLKADDLAAQVKAEHGVVLDYIKGKKTLVDGTESKTPPHLNLRDAANPLVGMGSFSAPLITAGEKRFRGLRAEWITQIVWRATALHVELWKVEGRRPELAVAALDEMLDRRLRAVEQMTCNVNAAVGAQLPTLSRTWSVAGSGGPWADGYAVRNFEYPVLPVGPFKAHLPKMKNWKVELGVAIVFSPPFPQAPVRMCTDLTDAWGVRLTRGGTLWVTYRASASRKATDVFRRMFGGPRENFFDRNWLFCDMVASATQVEALALGLRRRHGDDTRFEAVANQPAYLQLGPVVRFDRTTDLDQLMCDDKDPYFENTALEVDELQVGDFVCFWSSRVYDLIVPGGAWRNEFSFVMGVDVDGKTGKVRVLSDGPQVQLAGHGIDTVSYSGMAANLVIWIDRALTLVRLQLRVALAKDNTLREVKTDMGQTLTLWSPYEDFDAPGAWWLEIPKAVWHDDWDFATLAEVLASVPRTVAKEAGGPGYHAPKDDVAYFPLYEPVVSQAPSDADSWHAYLRQRKANAAFRAPLDLDATKVDARIATGLFYRGPKTRVPAVRPKPRAGTTP